MIAIFYPSFYRENTLLSASLTFKKSTYMYYTQHIHYSKIIGIPPLTMIQAHSNDGLITPSFYIHQ